MRRPLALAAALASTAIGAGCTVPDIVSGRAAERRPYLATDSMGVVPATAVAIRLQARPELVENSAATLSLTQPGVFFAINDSGNEPLLFAFDSTGADRGMWRVAGAANLDWEAASAGPCAAPAADTAKRACVYIGDVGDNEAERPTRAIYKVTEPAAQRAGFVGSVNPAALAYRYADGPRDVEAMYVAPNADTYLITKRRLRDPSGQRRPALVYRLPASAWPSDTLVVATLVDSLPIIPGSAPMRQITDAALSPDGRHLAVRTYAQAYIFATDSVTGRVNHAIPPSVCNIVAFDRWPGEGVAWFGRSGRLLLTSEGRESPLISIQCPLPSGTE